MVIVNQCVCIRIVCRSNEEEHDKTKQDKGTVQREEKKKMKKVQSNGELDNSKSKKKKKSNAE